MEHISRPCYHASDMDDIQETIRRLSENFVERLVLPASMTRRPCIIATIGLTGSGRTTAARRIAGHIPGAVLVQANSARYLLKEAGLPWGQNVRDIIKQVGDTLLKRGYAVVFDGNVSDPEDRANIAELAASAKAPVFYIRILLDPAVARERERKKYDNPAWVSSFEDFRVNSTEKMLQNIAERAELHETLRSQDIAGLVGTIDNIGTIDELEQQADQIAETILNKMPPS